jgi:hypothetical protein
MRVIYKILVEKYKEKSPLGEYGRRTDNNIKTDLRKTECEGANRIDLTQGTVQW